MEGKTVDFFLSKRPISAKMAKSGRRAPSGYESAGSYLNNHIGYDHENYMGFFVKAYIFINPGGLVHLSLTQVPI